MQGKNQKVNVFKREQKTGKVVADVTSVGRLFHKRLLATGKARGNESGCRNDKGVGH